MPLLPTHFIAAVDMFVYACISLLLALFHLDFMLATAVALLGVIRRKLGQHLKD